MAYEPKDNSGALFKNDKGDNQKRPDYRGDIRIDGRDFQLSAWIKQGQRGEFLSLSAEPKQDRAEQKLHGGEKQVQATQAQIAATGEDEDIPF